MGKFHQFLFVLSAGRVLSVYVFNLSCVFCLKIRFNQELWLMQFAKA